MNVSVIMPLFKPNPELMSKIDLSLKNQKFKGKIEVIKVDKGLGLAESINYGIKKSKYPIVVTLHQDCVPVDSNWLSNLVKPFKDKKVIATVSTVYLPKSLWDSFDFISKVLSAKEQKLITPLMDEKGCAYRKTALNKVGLFDSKIYRTAGEDFDMYLKLKKLGEIIYPKTIVIHYHEYEWKSRLKKELQLSNAFGALVRKYGNEMPNWRIGIIKSIPIIGFPLFLPSVKVNKIGLLSFVGIPLMLVVNLIYSFGFWKGFLMKRQTI